MSDFSDSAFITDDELKGRPIKAVPKPKKNIGIDTDDTLLWDLASVQGSQIDIGELERFTTLSSDRNQLYSLIDQMGADSTLSAALEIYAEDCTERNAQGKIVWAESNDGDTAKYINFLLDQLNVDKNVYKWVYSLCKYGDLYIRLYRESEVKDDLLDDKEENNTLNESAQADENATLNEDVKVKAFSKNDHFIHYVEAVANPAEMFELMKYGVSRAYICAPSPLAQNYDYTGEEAWLANAQNKFIYKFKKDDVVIYPPTEFVHAALEDETNRFPEKVDIFRTQEEYDSDASTDLSYNVRRGTSLLARLFKTWRELQLLENSVLLNRITKSAIVRLIQVEVGDMPKERVQPHLATVKSLIEQKSALKTGERMSEYTNPGPIENNVYIPTREGKGAISTTQVGGDVDVKSLVDLDYFRDKVFGSLRIPKQYMNFTDDSTGFNGGTSLSLISSRYAKMIRRIQTTMAQAITDIINILLVSKGQAKYINKFSIHMVEPTTEEDKNRQENLSSEIQVANDVMNLVSDMENPTLKLKILKALLSGTITNTEVIELLQQQIEEMEEQVASESEPPAEGGEDVDVDIDFNEGGGSGPAPGGMNAAFEADLGGEAEAPAEEPAGEEGGEELPSMNDLGLDFADSTQF